MVMKPPAEMLKRQQLEKTTVLVFNHHNICHTIFKAVHALNAQTIGSNALLLLLFRAIATISALLVYAAT